MQKRNVDYLRYSSKPLYIKTISEPVPVPFEGEYRNLLFQLMASTWVAVAYVVISLVAVYVLGYLYKPTMLFAAIQIPTVVACAYVVSPNPNISWRLPINWIATAVLAALVFVSKSTDYYFNQNIIGTFIGLIAWFFVIYWIISAITWSLKMHKQHKNTLNRIDFIELMAELVATWGATLQVAFIFSWIFMPFLEGVAYEANTTRYLLVVIESIKELSILRFIPISVFLLGLLVLASLRFQTDPYRPKTMNEVLPVKAGSLLSSFIVALRIPVWILVVIIGFITHFAKLFWESALSFFKSYIARLCLILIGLVVAPTLLYFGHTLVLQSLYRVNQYITAESVGIFSGIKQFAVVNLLMLLALCIYVISVPPLATHYRGEKIDKLLKSIYNEIITHGKAAAVAVGQTFSLFGIVPFVIPVASLLPGGPTFGLFSILYTVIVLTCFGFYLFTKKEELSVKTEA